MPSLSSPRPASPILLVVSLIVRANGAMGRLSWRKTTKVGGKTQLLPLFLIVTQIAVQIVASAATKTNGNEADAALQMQAASLGDSDEAQIGSINRNQSAVKRIQRRLFMLDFDENVDYEALTSTTTTSETNFSRKFVPGDHEMEVETEVVAAAGAKVSGYQNQSSVEQRQYQQDTSLASTNSKSKSGSTYDNGPYNDTSQYLQSSSTTQNSSAEVLELSALQAARLGYFRHSIPISVILAIAYTVVFVVGIVGNSFVVAIVCKSPRMRTVTNYFIANLALADILVLLFCLPATLVGNLFIPWVLGQFVCKAVSYLQGVAVSASINTMVTVTLDRFLAICFPLDWHMSRRMARWVIACIWIFSLSISLPWALYFTLHSYPLDNQTIQVCAEEWPSEQMDRIYFICANLILLYLFPATVIILCYLGIWYKIERRNIPGDQPPGLKIELIMQKSKLKVVKMMMVVVIMFLLSWLPTYLIFARIKLKDERGADEEWLIAKVMPLAQWLGASNSCINPILYTFFNRKYKRSFFDLLRFAFCCKPLMKTSGLTAEGQGYTIANKARGGNGQMRENGLSMVPLNLNHSGGPSDGGGVADNGGGSANGAGRQSNISTTSLAISGTSAQDNITSESIEATARSPAEACQIDTLHVHRSRNCNVKYGHHCGRDYAHRHHRHQHNHRHKQQPQQQQLQQRQQLLQHNHFNNNKATSSCNRRNHSNLWSKDNILVERDNNSVDSDTLVLRGHCSSSSRQQFIGGDTSPRAHQRQLPKTLSSKSRAKADRLGSSDKRVLSGADGDSSASGQHLELKQGPSRSRHRRRHHHIGCPRRREQHQIRSQSGSGRDDRLEQALERLVTPCDELDGLRQVELVAEHLDSECGFLQQ